MWHQNRGYSWAGGGGDRAYILCYVFCTVWISVLRGLHFFQHELRRKFFWDCLDSIRDVLRGGVGSRVPGRGRLLGGCPGSHSCPDPDGRVALSLWRGLLHICRFNNGNMHFTNERINSREMVFLATVALCFKGVGFI